MRNQRSFNILFCLLFVQSIFSFYSCSEDDSSIGEPILINTEVTNNTGAMILPDVHDPSQLIKIDNHLVFFASGVEWNIYDLNTKTWTFGGDDIYEDGAPTWYEGEDKYWAPGFIELNSSDRRIYHSAVEDEDFHQSKIGFVKLNGDPISGFSFERQDDYVLSSSSISDAFAIDPSVFIDKEDKVWLVYGSHGAGIYSVELNGQTGLLKENPSDKAFDVSDSRFFHLANYGGVLEENNVEAAYIFNHPESDYYYLFVNWDVCCNGVQSTYNIRIGRSVSPTGPFIDRDGLDMRNGGGSLFIDANGEILGDSRFVGPGHSGIYRHGSGTFYFSHHFYDGASAGMPSMAIWPLEWTDGWPTINTEGSIDF
jgi:arabinan endo-1,5-alpha-L-arabinosidase